MVPANKKSVSDKKINVKEIKVKKVKKKSPIKDIKTKLDDKKKISALKKTVIVKKNTDIKKTTPKKDVKESDVVKEAVKKPLNEKKVGKTIKNAKQLWLESREILKTKFKYTSSMQIPKLKKIVINSGIKKSNNDAKILDEIFRDLEIITNQKPIIKCAKKSIAAFSIRKGQKIGVSVTLRNDRMYCFFDKLVNIALANVHDFRGINPKSFDGHGNMTLGIKEQLIFPEIDYDFVNFSQGMDITIVTTANTDEEGMELLRLLGMPFMDKK